MESLPPQQEQSHQIPLPLLKSLQSSSKLDNRPSSSIGETQEPETK